jgi:hypothetical protein
MPRFPLLPAIVGWRVPPHVSLVRLVELATTSAWSPSQEREWSHVERCSSCAACFEQIVHLLASPPPASASDAETASAVGTVRSRLLDSLSEAPRSSSTARLIDTRVGARVRRALAPWLGEGAACAILERARAGRDARRDVLTAVARPLTAFLGEETGRALAVKVSRLAEVDRDGSLEIQA